MPHLPAHDTLTDVDVMRDFVVAQPLASVVTHDGSAPDLDLVDMLDKIVGIIIEVASLIGKFKVSAHRTEADRLGARDGIAAGSDSSVTPLVDAMGRPPQGTF